MPLYRIVPENFTELLTDIRAELVRRNGYGDLSGYSSVTFPEGEEVVSGNLIRPSSVNTLIEALGYINPLVLPDEVETGELIFEDVLDYISSALTIFQAQPSGAISNNDCATLCSGMCVTQCVSTCLSTCTGGCSETCTNACGETCSQTCTGTCTGTCSGTCTGTCSSSCSGGCTGSCTNGCKSGCTSCSGCRGCTGTCKGTCRGGCQDFGSISS